MYRPLGANLSPLFLKKEARMASRCCRNCVYPMRPESHWLRIILSRWAGLLFCFNCAEAPGRMQEVYPNGTCRNFRARRESSPRGRSYLSRNGDVAYIGLTKGKVAIVDAADFEWLSQYQWSAWQHGRTFYARRGRGNDIVHMHREIMQPPPGYVVDHIDGNGLNNRRSNLRICKPAQNACNTRPARGAGRFKGVFPAGTMWGAAIWHKGQEYWLGLFDDEIEAALARDRKARELQGEFAWLNFP